MTSVETKSEFEGQGQLFDLENVDSGRYIPGLPANVQRNAAHAARTTLYSMPRHDRRYGDDEGVEFWASRNVWHDYKGGMGISMTAKDIALSGAQSYMADLGAGYFRFTHELTEIAEDLAAEYDADYPPQPNSPVMLEPGY